MPTTTNGEMSMQELLEAMLSKTAESSKVNPPTTGPGAGAPDSEEDFTPGERNAEHDAFISETLGQTGAESSRTADSNTVPQHPAAASPKLPTGEDPKNESHGKGTPPNVEPGTSLSGAVVNEKEASFADKTSAWREASAQIILELVGEPSASEGDKTAAQADLFGGDAQTDKLAELVGDDQQVAEDIYTQVTEKLAAAHLEGRELARNALACLQELTKQAEHATANHDRSVSRTKRAMAEMLAEPDGQGIPAEELAPDAGMEGGMEGDMGGDDPAVIEQAIVELSEQMGVTPEELIAALEEAAASEDMGGGEPMGGEAMPAEMVEPPAEEPKMAADKTAADKGAAKTDAIRKRAREVVEELTRRGSRR